MSYSSSHSFPLLQEPPFPYSPSPGQNLVYEISLRAASDWLKDLQGAHRLVQALLQGQLFGQYELLDFLVWPEGLLARVSLKAIPSLSEFLRFIKEKSAPSGAFLPDFWAEDLQWIKLVTPEKLSLSTESFLGTADHLRQDIVESKGFSPSLFFFYRNPRLGR